MFCFQVVRGWLTDEAGTNNRNLLALHGYIMPRAITPADCDESLEDAIVDFLTLLPEYEVRFWSYKFVAFELNFL